MNINPHQISSIYHMRTKANHPGAEDIEAMDNRIIVLDWLYRLDQREQKNHPHHGLYVNLWQQFLELAKDVNPDV